MQLLLAHQGRVSHDVDLTLAEKEFEKFKIIQDKMLESDFDKELGRIQKKIGKKS